MKQEVEEGVKWAEKCQVLPEAQQTRGLVQAQLAGDFGQAPWALWSQIPHLSPVDPPGDPREASQL